MEIFPSNLYKKVFRRKPKEQEMYNSTIYGFVYVLGNVI